MNLRQDYALANRVCWFPSQSGESGDQTGTRLDVDHDQTVKKLVHICQGEEEEEKERKELTLLLFFLFFGDHS